MLSLRHSVNAINRYGKYIIAFRTVACLHYNVPNGRLLRTNVTNVYTITLRQVYRRVLNFIRRAKRSGTLL